MEEYTISSGNIFNDLGFANAKEKLAKAKLAAIINKLIEDKDKGLTQKEAAQVLAISQEEVSSLENGRLREFSMERLFSFLQSLDQHIEITITDRSKVRTLVTDLKPDTALIPSSFSTNPRSIPPPSISRARICRKEAGDKNETASDGHLYAQKFEDHRKKRTIRRKYPCQTTQNRTRVLRRPHS